MNEEQSVRVRSAESLDAQVVFDIRNHHDSRIFFHNQEQLKWEDHVRWFEQQYLRGGENRCYVLESVGRVVGYCRLDKQSTGCAILSIAVDPEYRGRGFGSFLLNDVIRRISEGVIVNAEVISDNQASRALFENSGFIFDEESNGIRHYHRAI